MINELKREQAEKELTEKALQIFQKENELENNEAFKQFMLQKKQLDDMLVDFKKELKKQMVENGITSLTSPKGKEDWSITCSEAHRVQADENVKVSDIDEKFVTKEPLDMDSVVIEDDKVYTLKPNVDLVKNLRALNTELPEGFVDKVTSRISIKVNGKAI